MNKRLLSILLLLALTAGLLAGCGGASTGTAPAGSTGSADSGSASGSGSAASGSSAGSESGDVTTTAVGTYSAENPYDLTFAFLQFYPQDAAANQAVQDYLNSFMIPEYHIRVSFLPLEIAQYQSVIQLMISGGDKLDIVPVFYDQAAKLINMNGLVDLTPYMDTPDGQKIKDALGAEIAMVGNQNGILYGFPAAKEFVGPAGLCLRKDICDELGITEEYGLSDDDSYTGKVRPWSDAEAIFAKVAAAYPNMVPLYVQGMSGSATNFIAYDALLDNFGVLDWEADHNSTKVVNLFETKEYRDMVTMLADWYDKGYIYKDAATDTQGSTTMFQAGNVFSYATTLKPGFISQNKMATGIDNYIMYLANQPEALTATANVSFGNTGVATNSDDPEMAFKFIAALYSDPRVMNTWQYGIPDVNYQVLPDGTATYVDGESGGSFKYHQGTAWSAGNQFIAYVWNDGTTDADYWDVIRDYNTWGLYSPAFGFAWDSTDYQTQTTALQSALLTYRAALETGAIGGADRVDEMLDNLNKALYASGLQEVMDAKQAQLDAWVAANGGPAETPAENLARVATVK